MTKDDAIFAKLLLQFHTAQFTGIGIEIENGNLKKKLRRLMNFSLSFRKSFILTNAPCFNSCSQKALPRPTAEPVTIATLSLNNI